MMSRRRFVCQTLVVLVLGFAHPGCGSSIAARYPHLERRAVCVRVPGVESDASEYLVTDAGEGISNFHPEVVDRIAPDARTVFEFDPGAEPDSVRHLPAPYNQLQCGPVFSILPSKDAEIPPLPTAAVDLLVHERRPEVVPEALAERLASCAQLSPGSFEPKQHTMALNVYVRRDGRVVSAYVAQSTLGERKTEACVVNVLRNTSWPGVVDEMMAASDVASSEGVKLFLSEPARTLPQPDTGPISEIRPKVQPTPASNPGGPRMPPRIFVIPLGPVLVAIAAFGIIFFYTEDDAPAWTSEINPVTKQPYTSKQEYDQIQQMTPDQIREAQKQITNAQRKPPAPAPPPAPMPPPAAGARKYPTRHARTKKWLVWKMRCTEFATSSML
ncbi:MAG TPA: hypothetical protein PK156_17685 [Polyangium sp.]|nr:hypothetical protein [Polyangium sp.]